ncbi:MAG: hypothetical protein M3Z00_09830 [Actinomycetota bacterium]|nr:hypothetical protein [Actinomycetota bacterium]
MASLLTLTRSRLLAVAAAFLLTVSLSSCSDHVGAAATVGGVSIDESFVTQTSAELAASAQAAASAAQQTSRNGNGDQLSRNRQVLTTQIRHDLLTQIPSVGTLDVPDAAVNSAVAGGAVQIASQLGVTQQQVPQAVRDSLKVLALAQRDAASQKKVSVVDVRIDLLSTFSSRTAAVAARSRYLANPAAMNQEVASAGTDANGRANGGVNESVKLLENPGLAALGLYSEPVGSILVINQGEQWSVVRIAKRTVGQSNGLPAAIQAAEGNAQANGSAAIFDLAWLALAPYVSSQNVSVNPRFGAWDPVTLQVVPTNSGL